jgi:acetate kinase
MTKEGRLGPVLVVNAGSSSLKVSLLAAALQNCLPDWLKPAPPDDAPGLIGHRVVHGGEAFFAPTLLGEEELGHLEDLVSVAPLHNGPALRVMRWLAAFRPELPPEAGAYGQGH